MDDNSSVGIIIIGILFVTFLAALGGEFAENVRLYKRCMVEMQDKPHKEAVSICKERTKE